MIHEMIKHKSKRSKFLKLVSFCFGVSLFWRFQRALAVSLRSSRGNLSDPANRKVAPMFEVLAPNFLDLSYVFKPVTTSDLTYNIYASNNINHETGLRSPSGETIKTEIYGYGPQPDKVTWPGRTIEVISSLGGGPPKIKIRWNNKLPFRHILPVDTTLHWAYGVGSNSTVNGVDYSLYSIEKDGMPMVTHVHGAESDFMYDGNPEFFYNSDFSVVGPGWNRSPVGFNSKFTYENLQVPAAALWYHDHTLGITRLNIYAGMCGFYIVRDNKDTGSMNNPLKLPAYPYELAYVIQDRMFSEDGSLFYPAFKGDPFYDDFITSNEDIIKDKFDDTFGGTGGPTVLAEFFGDHILVNGKIWPKADVEPRNYRMRLLNGSDSRFLIIQFVVVERGETELHESVDEFVDFLVIGSDQGLGAPKVHQALIIEPGARYDIVINFNKFEVGTKRIVMKNLGCDAPFSGTFGKDCSPEDLFENRQTDRIMAFDVNLPLNNDVLDEFDSSLLPLYKADNKLSSYNDNQVRRVSLFEGLDSFGRLQPLLGTVKDGDLTGKNIARALTWSQPTTEIAKDDTVEVWEIFNFSADAHPIHIHLVNFEILESQKFSYQVTGKQFTSQHNGDYGTANEISHIQMLNFLPNVEEYYSDAPKDIVTVGSGNPDGDVPTGVVTRVRVHFKKPGRYVWHCHVLSHEDNEMMRVLEVLPDDGSKKTKELTDFKSFPGISPYILWTVLLVVFISLMKTRSFKYFWC